jgi:hypothetical protein
MMGMTKTAVNAGRRAETAPFYCGMREYDGQRMAGR